MKRVDTAERPQWRDYAESVGFAFHTFDGEPYWDETAYYQFSLQQIEDDLEAPTEELHEMAMELVDEIVRDAEKLRQLAIPESFWNHIYNGWTNGEPHLYGRMDLVYNGTGPAKLLELNYDTPTSLFETGFFQWVWLEEKIQRGELPSGADHSIRCKINWKKPFVHFHYHNPFIFPASVKISKTKAPSTT